MAARFIEALPRGYDEPLGERGRSLSAGQRQLLSFARALVTDPEILVLDEATSNVDTETEALVQEALRRMLEGRTAIVIAHRLSTVRDADRIVVIHRGRVAEEGTHEELLRREGLYRTLYELQFGAAAGGGLAGRGTEGDDGR
jgi:ATP-binding cassette subfamily B protein